MTTAIYEGEEIQLAKCTLQIQLDVDIVDSATDIRQKADLMWDLLSDIVGDRLPELVDGDDYETCDLTRMSDLYYVVTDAYGNAMHKAQNEKQAEQQRLVDDMSRKVAMFNKTIENATKNIQQATQ